jgi:flagellar motor component MotA
MEKMKRDELIGKFTDLVRQTLSFAKMATELKGVSNIEDLLEDLIEEDFKYGLRHVVDGTPSTIINEIFTNKIAFEKDELERQYKTALKRAVLGIQAGESPFILLHVLMSYVDLTKKEKNKIEAELMKD